MWDNRVTSVSSDITSNGATKSVSETYTYDNYGRISGKWVNSSILEALFYRTPTATTTAGQVATQKYSGSGYLLTNNYTYDANGNITAVKTTTNENGTSVEKTTNYTYDTANQLIREDNQAANKTWIWTYDNAGNITSRTEFAYTPDANPTGGATVSYAYNNTNWGDLLTQVGANAITYDEIGNMRTYNGTTFTWKHGRELHTLTKNGVTWTNTYNADGIRTKRVSSNGTTYNYVYNGSSLSQMTVGGNTLTFAYDGSGSPMAVVYNGAVYYYITNLQGDVVAILDSNKNVVVEYTYDAWGRILTTSGSMATTLGVHNPLRYRGYVYDHEVGLYYLQSRYYDPALGRFINADALSSTGQGLLGLNMFIYCGNNPVCRTDSSGNTYEEASEEYRIVGAGVQLELDMGNITVGVEIIVYWDVEECEKDSAIIAVYTYSGGGVNFCDDYLGSITATVANNLDLLKSGTEDGISALLSILKSEYSASASGLLLLGNGEFTSVKSYEGPFVSMYGSIKHVKGAVAVSSNCVAIGIGGTSAVSPSWGISVTNYTLRGTMRIGNPAADISRIAI